MSAIEIMEKLFACANDKDYSNTCDTYKAGDHIIYDSSTIEKPFAKALDDDPSIHDDLS